MSGRATEPERTASQESRYHRGANNLPRDYLPSFWLTGTGYLGHGTRMRLRFVWLELGLFLATFALARLGAGVLALLALVSALGLHAYDFARVYALLRRVTTPSSPRARE